MGRQGIKLSLLAWQPKTTKKIEPRGCGGVRLSWGRGRVGGASQKSGRAISVRTILRRRKARALGYRSGGREERGDSPGCFVWSE